MFYKSTKIVVTGSNLLRKAGPRIGSLGYISDINLVTEEVYKNKIFFIFAATIFFYRYGYELTDRFEKKQVFVVLPFIEKEKEYSKDKVNNFIKSKKSCKTAIYLTISPVDDVKTFTSEKEFCAKVVSRLHGMQYFPFITSIVTKTDDRSNALNKISNLYRVLDIYILNFFFCYYKIVYSAGVRQHKQEVLNKYIISLLFDNKTDQLNKLLAFVNTLDVLLERHNNKKVKMSSKTLSKYINIGISYNYKNSFTSVITKLFQLYELGKIANKSGGLDHVAVTKALELRKDIANEGYNVLNLNKRT